MKEHTSAFKDKIKQMGRQLRAVISYNNTVLEDEIYSVTPVFEANILKSVMKQLDVETSVEIPVGTVFNFQAGLLVNDNYEMLNYGNYIVKEVEKQEDTDLYKLTCYDKMLLAMRKNDKLQDENNNDIHYPITIKNYLNALGRKLGLSVKNTNFYNYNMQIPVELYVGLDYTYRDILDEIAQATGSMIIINSNDEIEVKYPTETGDTIDEEFLKDVNVDFGEIYGPVNTIVLSRSGEADEIPYPYPPPQDAIEIKIKDNQIMNFDNRSDFLPGIYAALNGLYYYINDFSSTGIMYYEPGDFYNVQVGENSYKCLMLNDEINITTGIEETIHTDMPEQSETDYSKTDKTDMRINKTTLIVNKQNQTIEGLITNVGRQDTKISRLTQRVDEISSEISDISGITVTGYSNEGSVTLEGINVSEPIDLKVQPIINSIKYLYPGETLNNEAYPSNNTYMSDRVVRFKNTSTNETFDCELPSDLLWYDIDNYDEFRLSYETQTCQVIKRCKLTATGEITTQTEEVINYEYPFINLTEGNYTITVPGYYNVYLYVRLMGNNVYTDQFATKIEMNSKITQTAQEINLGVDTKLSNYSTTNQMNSAINLKADQITSTVSQTYETKGNAQANYSQLTQTAQGLQTQVSSKVGNEEVISKINQSSEEIEINANKISLAGKTIRLTSDNISIAGTNFSVTKEGNMTCSNANISGTINATNGTFQNCTITNSCSVPASTVSGTLSTSNIPNMNASKITSGTINADTINVTNLNASNVNRGSLSNLPYSFATGNESMQVSSSSTGIMTGYRSGSRRWALASFTAGGKLQMFDSNGNMAAYFDQSGAYNSSDIRYKENIKNINAKKSIKIITSLSPIEYTFKNQKDYHRGLSAQELEKTLKENNIENQIYEINKEGMYSINYIELIPDLINCIKYQQEEIKQLQKEIKELKGE